MARTHLLQSSTCILRQAILLALVSMELTVVSPDCAHVRYKNMAEKTPEITKFRFIDFAIALES